MSDKAFVDTNVLIYAHDADAAEKQNAAAGVLTELWETRLGVLSMQVLQEFYVYVTRKISTPLRRSVARQIVRSYSSWELVTPGIEELLQILPHQV